MKKVIIFQKNLRLSKKKLIKKSYTLLYYIIYFDYNAINKSDKFNNNFII